VRPSALKGKEWRALPASTSGKLLQMKVAFQGFPSTLRREEQGIWIMLDAKRRTCNH